MGSGFILVSGFSGFKVYRGFGGYVGIKMYLLFRV